MNDEDLQEKLIKPEEMDDVLRHLIVHDPDGVGTRVSFRPGYTPNGMPAARLRVIIEHLRAQGLIVLVYKVSPEDFQYKANGTAHDLIRRGGFAAREQARLDNMLKLKLELEELEREKGGLTGRFKALLELIRTGLPLWQSIS